MVLQYFYVRIVELNGVYGAVILAIELMGECCLASAG
jgi:hypothetical protein